MDFSWLVLVVTFISILFIANWQPMITWCWEATTGHVSQCWLRTLWFAGIAEQFELLNLWPAGGRSRPVAVGRLSV